MPIGIIFNRRSMAPLVEMYWAVVRFGIKDWAVKRLRSAAIQYIVASRIVHADWIELYGFELTMFLRADEEKVRTERRLPYLDAVAADRAIQSIVRAEVFDKITVGGPFGQDGQYEFARMYLGIAISQKKENYPQSVERRLARWEACHPWTEGLARLFDSAQEEVVRQFGSLSIDGHNAESVMLELSIFERIAYKHLVSLKNRAPMMASPAGDAWPLLVTELDKQQVPLEENLDPKAMATLSRMRKKRGFNINMARLFPIYGWRNS